MAQPFSRDKVNRGIAWVGGASSYVAVLDIVSLILILKFWVGIEEFGVATTVLAFNGTFELLAEIGITSAIIQRTRQSAVQLSTLYWLSIFFGVVVCTLIYLAAPLFASLHHHEIITPLFRIYSLYILFRSFYSCQLALMKRELRFKEFSVIRVCSNSVDFIVRVGSAAYGVGPLCFILGPIARTIVEGVGVLLRNRWRPQLVFDLAEARGHIVFGVKSSTAEIIYRTYSNCDYWVVSIFFGLSALGLYRAAYDLVLEPIRFMSLVVTNVAFPVFSRLKENLAGTTEQYWAFVRQNCIVIGMFVSLILVCADELLVLLFRPEYAAAALAARILALVGGLRAISHLGPSLLDGMGRPGITLRYQGVSAVILVTFFFLFARLFGNSFGFNAVALAWAVGYPIGFLYLTLLISRALKSTLFTLFGEIRPILLCMVTSIMVGGGGRFLVADGSPLVRLVTGGVLAATVFLLLFSAITGITPRSVFTSLKR